MSNWIGHSPFAQWLVEKTSPELVVELGTFTGFSAEAFAIAMMGHGELHTIEMDKANIDMAKITLEEYKNAKVIHNEFDNVIDDYEDHSIDILHIDGDHMFKSVLNDAKKWIKKISLDGVLLMHDVFNPSFIGPLVVFSSLSTPRVIFPKALGLGVSTANTSLMREIHLKWYDEIVGQGVIGDMLNLWQINGALVAALMEKAGIQQNNVEFVIET